MEEKTYLSQRSRLCIFGIYAVLLWFIGGLVTAKWLITPGSPGIWFYAILAYLALHLIIAPFFKTPKDILANTITCLAFLLAFNLDSEVYHSNLYIVALWWIALVYLAVLLGVSVLAILCKDSIKNFLTNIGKVSAKFCDYFGSGKIEFTFIVLLSVFGYHISYPNHIWALSLFWIFLVTVEPIEKFWKLFGDILAWKELKKKGIRVGKIKAYENPSLALIVLDRNLALRDDEVLWLTREGNKAIACLPLSQSQLHEESWCRVLLTNIKVENLDLGGELSSRSIYHSEGEMFSIPMENLPKDVQEKIQSEKLFSKKGKLFGYVAEGSHLNHIYFDIINSNLELSEGLLLEVSVRDENVVYQITDATLKCEGLAQKNTEGFTRGQARKIGVWNPTKDKFDTFDWIPSIYTPICACDTEKAGFHPDYVGYIPGSEYRIKWSPHSGVTHNTAILGILGIGKSYLAYELIARMIKADIKVICLDITGEYQPDLDNFLNSENSNSTARIDKAIKENRNITVEKQDKRKGGNHNNFRQAIQKEIEFLLREDNPEMLRIWNPESFDVTKQEWQGGNVTVPLTPVEVTRIISESLLNVVKEEGLSKEKARICLVLEEAHSLIPEWSSVSAEGDKQASNATAKAIMQGRKYGMGSLVITQRTANVIKSVLNQCNTVFAMRVFDATGMEFLKNYIGEEYTEVLTSLKERHAVIFGRASSSDQPVIIRINEREDFLSKFEISCNFKNIEVPDFNETDGEDYSENNEDTFSTDNEIKNKESDEDLPF
mgnify:CR=1 FL=1